jgi:hypothetical protein
MRLPSAPAPAKLVKVWEQLRLALRQERMAKLAARLRLAFKRAKLAKG